MSDAAADVAAEPRARRRRWPWFAGAGVVLVAAAAVVTTVLVRDDPVRDEGYGPIRPSAASGFAGPAAAVRGETPRPGTVGYAVSFLENLGDHAVRVTSLTTTEPVSGSGWAPATHSYTIFDVSRWRRFPATVPAHGVIQVRLTIGPSASCRNLNPKDGIHLSYVGGYDAHWQSRRSNHTTHVEQDGSGRALRLC